MLHIIFSCEKKLDDSLIQNFSSFFPIQPQGKMFILIIPADVSCPACRDKSLDFIEKNEISYLYTIITSNDAVFVKKLINERNLKNKKRLYIDTKNYCFLQDLAFMKPVIYKIENKKLVHKVELTPLNIDQELSKLLKK